MIILGLGCNIGDRLMQLRQAYTALRDTPSLHVMTVSPVYESSALLPEDAPDTWDRPYLNCAIACRTTLAPKQLLSELKRIERQCGRDDTKHWAPRPIDIDILAWDDQANGNLIVSTELLTIPHPSLTDRPFALWPLADLMPQWQYPLDDQHKNKHAEELVLQWGSRFDGQAPLNTKQIAHRIDTPKIMGILNITDNSYSDGGLFIEPDKAVEHAINLFNAGADIIDIGAESTRPGGKTVSQEQEWQRIEPVIKALQSHWQHHHFKPLLSLDTRKHQIAEAALNLGVDWINDVSGGDDTAMRDVIKDSSCQYVFMHHNKLPEDRRFVLARQDDPVNTVLQWCTQRRDELINAGIDASRLIVDPGIGFGKVAEHDLQLINEMEAFAQLHLPILAGHSRKTFMNRLTVKPFAERDLETAVISTHLAKHVDILRVHNVDMTLRALKIKTYLH